MLHHRAMRATPLNELFRASPEPLVEDLALAIAADLNPHLDVAPTIASLDAMGEALRRGLRGAESVAAQADAIASVMYDELGFTGNSAEFHDPRNSDLAEVVARRTGLPITLGVVLMAVGRRAGIVIEGISFPGHFLVRVGGSGGLYLDPFDRAHVVDEHALHERGRRTLGGPLRPEHLQPVGARAIAARMLANLKNLFERRGDHARALVACDRLVDLTSAPEVIRDRGAHALALGAHAAAREDFARYLRERPDASDAASVQEQLRRASRTSAIQ